MTLVSGADAAGPPVHEEEKEKNAVYEKMEVFAEILMHVKRNYIEEKKLDEVIEGAIHGMLQSLDQHSDYLDSSQYREMREGTTGAYGGIGVHVGIRNDVLTVIAPIEDSPGFVAGLMPGDVIMAIDGKLTRKMNLSESITNIKGAEGTTVILTIVREGDGEPIDIRVRRGHIEVASVKGVNVIREKIGYIRITQFSAPTEKGVQKALEELSAKKIKGLIIDVRNNPGGLVNSAVEVADMFLEKGKLIMKTQGRSGSGDIVERRARRGVSIKDMPLVVLINGGSASAAEIFAGALQDNGRAVLLGDRTYGKGSVQSIIPLQSTKDTGIRLTTAHYFTPSGGIIHEQGIEPDIYVYLTPQEWFSVQRLRAHTENRTAYTEADASGFAGVRDRQLDRAVDLVDALTVHESIAGAKKE